jgi:outer membrane receptor protein involved in Fe transport
MTRTAAKHFQLSALALCLSATLPLMAQQSPDGAADEAAIEKITVRGEKTARSLQETTSSVAVTTALRIEQENLQSLFDVLSRTANVSQMYGNRGFTIRGIADEAGAPNPLATVYLDGAALPSQIGDSGPTDLWDIAQVEVLRGPQSTIQGENALAGAIILRTEDPTMDWNAKARLLWSDPSDRRIAFAGGGPLIEDELAFRLAVEQRDFDGFVYNPTRNTEEDTVDALVARAKLLWTPSTLPGFTARLSFMRDDHEGPYMYSYSRLDEDDYFNNRVNTSNRPNTTDIVSDVSTLELSYEFSDAWSLSAVTSSTSSDAMRSYDNDLTEAERAFGNTDENYDSLSQELRLHFTVDKFRGLVGLYGSKREADYKITTLSNVVTPLGTIAAVLQANGLDTTTANYLANLYGQSLPLIPVDYHNDAPSESENKAIFTDLEYQFTTEIALLAGFRYDNEKYTYASETTANFVGILPDPLAFGAAGTALNTAVTGINYAVLGLVADANGITPSSTRDFTAFLPKLGLRWDYSTEQSLAFTAQRGYRSGGSSYNIARSEIFAYEPEFTTNYELAWRSSWLDNSVTLNSNLYYIDWKDKQVTASFGLNNFDTHTVNAGKAHLYGLELEARQRLNNSVDWYSSYGFSRTQYDQFDAILGASITDYAGQEFAYAPRHTFAIGSNYYFADSWSANLNANYRSSVFMNVGVSDQELSSRTLVNAKLSYDADVWSVYLFANNLLDKGYVQYRWPAEPNAIFGDPRVVGVGLEGRW